MSDAAAPWLAAFQERDRDLRLYHSKVAHALIVVLVPAGVSLDWLIYPGLVGEFLAVRVLVAVLAGLALLFHYSASGRDHIRWLAMLSPLLANAMISWMTYRSEGAASPYYAGLNLVLTGIAVLVPWTLVESALACMLTACFYTAACAAHGTLDEKLRLFFGNLYFLALTGIICTTAAHLRHRARVAEFRLSSELARSYQQVSELERLKTEFFANVSHELRTPLTLILSPLGDLGRRLEELPADLRELVGIARDNSLRLLRLVNDLLEVSRLESGDLKLHPEPLDLAEFSAAQGESVRPLARLKGLELRIERAPGHLWVTADPTHVEKILVNLLTNAIKFTPKGGRVTLRSRLDGTSAVVEVEDTGIGIAEGDLSIVFERFRQADGSSRRRFSGVGIGLSLARELAERNAGTLGVTSQLGAGSTFTLRLPEREQAAEALGAVPDSATPSKEQKANDDTLLAQLHDADRFVTVAMEEPVLAIARSPAGARATVLVIDDEPDMRRYLGGILADQYHVLKAEDGVAGLELARRERPELVVVDLMMPGMNGWEVCAALKREATEEAPKVMVVTARTDEMAKIAALKHGADDFLSKPFSTLEVRTRLSNLCLAHELERNLRLQNVELKDTLAKLRSAEARLVEREKMEAVVRMAGGILHEINNPLNFTLTAISVALDRGGNDAGMKSILEDVQAGMVRVKDIVADLRSFASPQKVSVQESFPFQDLVDQALRFTSVELRNVQIDCEIPEGYRVYGSKSQLLQVLTNLLLNAGAAVSAVTPERTPNIKIVVSRERGATTVRVRDNGTGIPAELIGKVFDPFLTTREVGQGMGLGLSICRAVIAAHGGEIRLKSEAGNFTEVEFELPYRERGAAA